MEDYALKPEKRPRASTAFTVIICIVFGLLYFVFALSAGLLFSVRDILSHSVLSYAVGKINPADWEIGMFLDEEEIGDFCDNWYLPKNTIDVDSTIAEVVSDSAAQYGLRITTFDIEELMDESGIMPAIGELFAAYERYLLTGEDDEPFSRRALMAEIKNHRSEIMEYTGIDISIFYEAIETTLRKNSRELSRLNPSELTNGAGKYMSIALSLPVIVICLVLSAGMAALALLITKRPIACIRTLGIVYAAVGALLITLSLLIATILRETLTALRSSSVRYISNMLNGSVAPILVKFGIIFAGAGVLLIIVSVVWAVISKKISAKKTAETV